MTYKDRKLVHILHYLMSHCAENACDKVHLLKLMWMADRYHLRKFGSTMANASYLAYPHGPVNQHAYDILKAADVETCSDFSPFFISIPASNSNEKTRYRTVEKIDYNCLSESNLEALGVAIHQMAILDSKGVNLSEYSHRFREWQNVESEIDADRNVFPPVRTADFFLPTDDPNDEYCTSIPDELVNINRDLVVEG